MNNLDSILQDHTKKVFKAQNDLILNTIREKNLPLNSEDYEIMITGDIKHIWYKPYTEEAQLVITLYPFETNAIFSKRNSNFEIKFKYKQ